MSARSNLDEIMRNLEPQLKGPSFVFCSIPAGEVVDLSDLTPLATFVEDEGMSLILREADATKAGLETDGTFRCITLQVHSSLESVGLTATVSSALAREGISANVVAAAYHDHIFVPASRAQEALGILKGLSSEAMKAAEGSAS